jgi:hypothetical protein
MSAVKSKTAQNSAEELVILSVTENAPKIASQIREIPCCDNNVQKVIVEMAADVAKWWGKNTAGEKIRPSIIRKN